MTKIFLIFFLTITLLIFGQTSQDKTKGLIGKWSLKNHIVEPKGTYHKDSLKIVIEFKDNGSYSYNYTWPNNVPRPVVEIGKWKLDSTQKQILLYSSVEESSSQHKIPDKGIKIIKLTKKKMIIYETLTPYPGGKSIYTRQLK